jgi:hypothetical protein
LGAVFERFWDREGIWSRRGRSRRRARDGDPGREVGDEGRVVGRCGRRREDVVGNLLSFLRPHTCPTFQLPAHL